MSDPSLVLRLSFSLAVSLLPTAATRKPPSPLEMMSSLGGFQNPPPWRSEGGASCATSDTFRQHELSLRSQNQSGTCGKSAANSSSAICPLSLGCCPRPKRRFYLVFRPEVCTYEHTRGARHGCITRAKRKQSGSSPSPTSSPHDNLIF